VETLDTWALKELQGKKAVSGKSPELGGAPGKKKKGRGGRKTHHPEQQKIKNNQTHASDDNIIHNRHNGL